MDTTLQTRIDSKLKKDAQKTLKDMGLDLSTGVKLFLTQVVRTQSIPFELYSFNNLSEAKKRAIVNATNDALKNGQKYRTAKALHDDILDND